MLLPRQRTRVAACQRPAVDRSWAHDGSTFALRPSAYACRLCGLDPEARPRRQSVGRAGGRQALRYCLASIPPPQCPPEQALDRAPSAGSAPPRCARLPWSSGQAQPEAREDERAARQAARYSRTAGGGRDNLPRSLRTRAVGFAKAAVEAGRVVTRWWCPTNRLCSTPFQSLRTCRRERPLCSYERRGFARASYRVSQEIHLSAQLLSTASRHR
jgi:hypothetical protein